MQFIHNSTDILHTFANLNAHGFFNTHTQCMAVLVCTQIVKTVCQGQCLRVGKAFIHFLDTSVDIPAVRINLTNNFTFQRNTEAHYTMSSRVLRTDVDYIFFFAEQFRAPITMDGKAVFRFAVDALPKCLHTVLDETRLTLEDLSWVVCHQANSRIIDHCIKALQADPAKFYKNMDRHGNTSAASIPVALNELAESGQLKPGQLLACIGFGGGLTWGGMIVEYDPLRR